MAVLLVSAPALTAGVASAAVSPALGRWGGSGQGGTLHFVVSRVGGTDVFSDLVEQCGDHSHRSTRAYSRLVSLAHIRFVRSFYPCSSATAPDVLSRSRYGEVLQLDHPRVGRAQLVTISIGGNDAGFVHVLVECTRLYGRLHHNRCYRRPAAHRILGGIEALRGTLAGTFDAICGRPAAYLTGRSPPRRPRRTSTSSTSDTSSPTTSSAPVTSGSTSSSGRVRSARRLSPGPSPERRRAASVRAGPAPGARADPLMLQSSGRKAIIPG